MINVEITAYGQNLCVHSILNEKSPVTMQAGDFFKIDYKSILEINDLFTPINGYIEKFSTDDKYYNIVSEFYSKYEEQRENSIFELEKLVTYYLSLLIDFFPYEHFKSYIKSNYTILVPKDTQEEFIYDQDLSKTEEKTYLKDDYIDLCCFIMYIRFLTPIFLEYYSNKIKGISQVYQYKVFNIILSCMDREKIKEMNKIEKYIDSIRSKDKKLDKFIFMSGLSDLDIIDSFIAEIIFNKLIFINFIKDNSNIISYIYQSVKNKDNYSGSENIFKNKFIQGDVTKEDISYFEDYRKASNVPIGSIVEIQVAMSDVLNIVRHLNYQNFDVNQYNIELSALLNTYIYIKKPQIIIVGIIIGRFINPRCLYYIEYRKLIELIAMSKVILLNNGFDLFAALVTSSSHKQLDIIEKRTIVNKDLIRELVNNRYRYMGDNDRCLLIENSIIDFCKEVYRNIWIPVGYIKNVEHCMKNNRLYIPDNLPDHFARFVLFGLGGERGGS